MSRLARADVFAPDEIAFVHVISRVVRRCFLSGNDPVTGKNFVLPIILNQPFSITWRLPLGSWWVTV